MKTLLLFLSLWAVRASSAELQIFPLEVYEQKGNCGRLQYLREFSVEYDSLEKEKLVLLSNNSRLNLKLLHPIPGKSPIFIAALGDKDKVVEELKKIEPANAMMLWVELDFRRMEFSHFKIQSIEPYSRKCNAKMEFKNPADKVKFLNLYK